MTTENRQGHDESPQDNQARCKGSSNPVPRRCAHPHECVHALPMEQYSGLVSSFQHAGWGSSHKSTLMGLHWWYCEIAPRGAEMLHAIEEESEIRS